MGRRPFPRIKKVVVIVKRQVQLPVIRIRHTAPVVGRRVRMNRKSERGSSGQNTSLFCRATSGYLIPRYGKRPGRHGDWKKTNFRISDSVV